MLESIDSVNRKNQKFDDRVSNLSGPEWATDYLSAPVCDWSAQEIDVVDWVFNSSAVLRELANLMEQHEGLTYERDAVRPLHCAALTSSTS